MAKAFSLYDKQRLPHRCEVRGLNLSSGLFVWHRHVLLILSSVGEAPARKLIQERQLEHLNLIWDHQKRFQ